jgi:hypothetical protein
MGPLSNDGRIQPGFSVCRVQRLRPGRDGPEQPSPHSCWAAWESRHPRHPSRLCTPKVPLPRSWASSWLRGRLPPPHCASSPVERHGALSFGHRYILCQTQNYPNENLAILASCLSPASAPAWSGTDLPPPGSCSWASTRWQRFSRSQASSCHQPVSTTTSPSGFPWQFRCCDSSWCVSIRPRRSSRASSRSRA